jgi:hypothetical protein
MRCQYQFNVKGHIRLGYCFPFTRDGFEYDFVCDENGMVRRIDVTVQVPDKLDWPSIQSNPAPGISAHFNFTSPSFPIIKLQIRTIEGLLAIYGVESIDSGKQVWLPENDQEKAQLQLESFEQTRKEFAPHELKEFPFNLVAQSVLAAGRSRDIEVALSFHRKGKQDIREERFIEAYYDFYFMIESMFGKGKFKKDAIIESFRNDPVLVEEVEKTKNDTSLMAWFRSDRIQLARAQEKYFSKTTPEILNHIVELRGFLHHHNVSRPGIWHPDDHQEFKADAFFMQALCHQIAFRISSSIVLSPQITAEYHQTQSANLSNLRRYKLKAKK